MAMENGDKSDIDIPDVKTILDKNCPKLVNLKDSECLEISIESDDGKKYEMLIFRDDAGVLCLKCINPDMEGGEKIQVYLPDNAKSTIGTIVPIQNDWWFDRGSHVGLYQAEIEVRGRIFYISDIWGLNKVSVMTISLI